MENLHAILRELLEKRGVTGEEELREFLSESPQRTYDPFLLRNMEAGVVFLLKKMEEGHRICIYGDYDCDGVTSTAILMQVLRQAAPDPSQIRAYIPSRFDEGYGLNPDAIRKLRNSGVQMIVTVDCGSVSVAEAALAEELGMDMLITDHHTVGERLPGCLMINPRQPGCPYPFKGLAGCGVAFKLAQAIQQRKGLPRSLLTSVLDLVAIGTIGDIVPLVDENRTLVKYGLKALKRTGRAGLQALARSLGLSLEDIRSETVAYQLVPHINAAGRMGSPYRALQLLTAGSRQEQEEMASALVEANRQRRAAQEEAYRRCLRAAEERHGEDLFIILREEGVHEGIAGIVAGKLKDRLNRPVVLVTDSGEENAYLKGTGRSIGQVNLYEVLNRGRHLFEKFGGHAGACGFLMRQEGLEELRTLAASAMEQRWREQPDLFQRIRVPDGVLSGGDVTLALAEGLEALEPFGFGNEKPSFLLTGTVPRRVSRMGGDGKHLRFQAEGGDGSRVSCVLFGEADCFEERLRAEEPVELMGSLAVNRWNGRTSLQFIVRDIAE